VALRLVAGNTARQQETNFGDYMASLLVRRAKALPGFEGRFGPVDVGLFTGGGFRTDIEVRSLGYGMSFAHVASIWAGMCFIWHFCHDF
jgi:hypothetical protein